MGLAQARPNKEGFSCINMDDVLDKVIGLLYEFQLEMIFFVHLG